MDTVHRTGRRTMQRVTAGLVGMIAAAALAGGTAAAEYHGTSDLTTNQQAAHSAGGYFGVDRTSAGYIPGL